MEVLSVVAPEPEAHTADRVRVGQVFNLPSVRIHRTKRAYRNRWTASGATQETCHNRRAPSIAPSQIQLASSLTSEKITSTGRIRRPQSSGNSGR